MPDTVRKINVALQGGGSHGAFTWGVLDRLLEEDAIEIEAVSATSAGAMNAVALAYGVSIGGRAGAREKLGEFWREISLSGQLYSPVRATPWERWFKGATGESNASFAFFEAITRVWSPYQLNPFNFNPLADVLGRVIDFERLNVCNKATRLYVSATNVRTGKIRVFGNDELSAKAVLASACLPYIFQAVEIDGEHFWDGGYMGNPALFPLIYNSASRDVLIVHINPIERAEVPTTASEIFDRINEISFNSSLMREMRAIAFVTRLIDEGALDSNRYNRMLVHSIRSDADVAGRGVASKLNPDWSFITDLKEAGRRRASAWLEQHLPSVGKESTADIAVDYL
jgi:NTE family protein